MTDRILSFQFKQTREKISDRGGLAIIDELIHSSSGDARTDRK